MTDYCKHYRIDKGESRCWRVADREREKRYCNVGELIEMSFACMCEGNKARCDFEKVGGTE